MIESTFLILLNLGIFVVSTILISKVFPSRQWPVARWLSLLLFSICLVSFFTLCAYANDNQQIKAVFYRLRYIGYGFIAPAWILFISTQFNRWKFLSTKPLVYILFVPGIITALLSVIPSFQHLIINNLEPIDLFEMNLLRFQSGSWFPIHYIWSMFLTLAGYILSAFIFKNGDTKTKKQISLLMYGSMITIAVDLFCVSTDSPWRWAMLTSSSHFFTTFAIAIGVYRYRHLAEVLREMRQLHYYSPEPILLLDRSEKIMSYNPAAQRQFNLTSKNIGEYFYPLRTVISSNSHSLEWTDSSQNKRYYEFTKHPIKGDDSIGDFLFLKDVTDFKLMKKELSEDLEFRQKLMNLIAHDIYGHVQNQVRLSEDLKSRFHGSEDSIPEIMYKSASNSQELISNLIEWSKTQNKSFTATPRPFEILTLLEEIKEEVSTLYLSKSVNLILKTPVEPRVLFGDSQILNVILRNLLTNALRASSELSEVILELNLHKDNYTLQVTDRGSGIDEIHLESLLTNRTLETGFAPGSYDKGFGFGFSVVRNFVDLLKGKIEIKTQLGQGTQVKLTFPLEIPSR